MNKIYKLPFFILLISSILTLTGCNSTNEKITNFTILYIITTVFASILLIGYSCLIEKKDLWFCLLFFSVFIVNLGYLALAISKTLEEALLANRIAYLGSVFLPLTMLMIIINESKIKIPKIISGLLLSISIIVFFIAASPGYLDIYYKSVTLEVKNGVALLVKEYGSWHKIYLFYLLLYFGLMTATIIYVSKKKILKSSIHVFILLNAVFINIVIWGIEQIIKIDFELLSISYIITELFLLSFNLMVHEHKQISTTTAINTDTDTSNSVENFNNFETTQTKELEDSNTNIQDNIINSFSSNLNSESEITVNNSTIIKQNYPKTQLNTLTKKELEICELYINGYKSKDIMTKLNITENTLKYHNKNIYSKLGINSRKQLLELTNAINEIICTKV